MVRAARGGTSLVELLVALVLLGIAGVWVLGAALAVTRLDRQARSRSRTDLGRRDTLAALTAAPDCRSGDTPRATAVVLPADSGRPALTTTIRCGR